MEMILDSWNLHLPDTLSLRRRALWTLILAAAVMSVMNSIPLIRA